jgi:soluble lytic murein transglycosylase-like protein
MARRRRRRGRAWRTWGRRALETGALLATALLGVIAGLGWLADVLAGAGLVAFSGGVLALALITAAALRGWLAVRGRLARRGATWPAVVAVGAAALAVWLATGASFERQVASLRGFVGGRAETQRMTVAHQVYAAYRRSDLAELARVLERARVYEPTVVEAATAFGVDPEVLMGVGAAESAFYPRDSADGGRGLFQITAPPADAVAEVRRRLHAEQLDPLNQRHNAFLAAATLRRYLDEMHGDPFLGLLAYNIGPRNGGLRAIMEQYGARDFVTIQPYLHTLPRDYPIRVLSAALAYRLWHTEGHLPRYEDGGNAQHIQSVGIPGLAPVATS